MRVGGWFLALKSDFTRGGRKINQKRRNSFKSSLKYSLIIVTVLLKVFEIQEC